MTVNIITGGSGAAASTGGGYPVGKISAPAAQKVIAPEFQPDVQILGDQPDVLLSTRFKDELDALSQGHRLNSDHDHYFEASHPKAALSAGPNLWPAFGPVTAADVVCLDCQGLFPLDEWTLSFKLSPTAVDFNAYTNATLLTFSTRKGAATINVVVGGGTMNCTLPGKDPTKAIVAQGLAGQATGKVPAGGWLTCFVCYAGSSATFTLHTIASDGTRLDSNPASNFTSPGYVPNDVPWFGTLRQGAATNIKLADVQLLRHARVSQTAKIFTVPTVTLAAGTPVTASSPGLLAGQIAVVGGTRGGGVNATSRARILGDIPGCGLFRIPDCLDIVTVTDTVTGTPRFTYDFTILDAELTDYTATGRKGTVGLGYMPPALGPTHNGAPTDANLYAQVCSDVVAHCQANFPNVIAYPFWNEPASYYTGTQASFLAMYRTVQTKLLAVNGVALGGIDTYYSDPMFQAWLTDLQSHGAPAPATLHHHDYSGDLGSANTAAMRGALRAIKTAVTAAGFSGNTIPLYVSEWNYDLQEASERVSSNAFPGSLAPLTNFYQTTLMPAFTFAAMCQMDAEGVAGAMFTRLQTDPSVDLAVEGYLALFTEDPQPRPQPVFGAFQPLWAMGASARVSAVSNEPGVYTLATKDASTGVIVWAYGAYGHGPRNTRFDLSLVASGLPATYTWEQWECSPDTIGDGRMRVIGAGNQDTVPTWHRMWANSVGCLKIKP